MRIRIKDFELGQDLMEFAIIFPILFMILVGIFDLGRVVYFYSALTNAAREGARKAVVDPSNTTYINNTVNHYAIGLNLGCPDSTPTPEPSVIVNIIDQDLNGRDDHVTVRLCYQFRPVSLIIGGLLGLAQGDSIILHGQASMRIEE